MKKLAFLMTVAFMLVSSYCLGQERLSGTISRIGDVHSLAQIDGTMYTGAVYNIGCDTLAGETYINRSYYTFDLSSIPTNANATITNAYLTYTLFNEAYEFTLTEMTSTSGEADVLWAAIGNATSLHTDLAHDDTDFDSTPIQGAAQRALSSGTLILGALSESEGTIGSASFLSITLEIDYEYDARELSFTASNNPDGGNIGAAQYPTTAISRASSSSFTAYEGKRLNLEAYDNQTINSKTYFFNDTEYPSTLPLSEWRRVKGTSSTSLGNNASFTTGTLAYSYNGANFRADLKTVNYSTSGTLSSNETWYTTNSLAGDVSVPSGVTLTIPSTATVNLNAHSIISTGGTITLDAGAGISPNKVLLNRYSS